MCKVVIEKQSLALWLLAMLLDSDFSGVCRGDLIIWVNVIASVLLV